MPSNRNLSMIATRIRLGKRLATKAGCFSLFSLSSPYHDIFQNNQVCGSSPQSDFIMTDNRESIMSPYAHMRRSSFSQPVNMAVPNPEPLTAPGTGESNVPDRHELFILGEGEKKVTETIDTRRSTPFCSSTAADHTAQVSAVLTGSRHSVYLHLHFQ